MVVSIVIGKDSKMNKILEKYFIKIYPRIFVDMYGDPKKTCMWEGISTGDGWFFLLDGLCSEIQWHIDYRAELISNGYQNFGEQIPQFVAKQIKEKFGRLTIYYDGGNETIHAWVEMARSLSHNICENCGAMNQHVGRVTKGWIQSLCSTCAKEYGKKIVQRKDMLNLWNKVVESRHNPKRSWKSADELTKEDFEPFRSKKQKKEKK
jgi:hypothetical protein